MIRDVIVDKGQYHQQREMIQWCEEFVGKGCWTWEPPLMFEGMYVDWTVCCTFGTTVFSFKDSKQATLFRLKWL